MFSTDTALQRGQFTGSLAHRPLLLSGIVAEFQGKTDFADHQNAVLVSVQVEFRHDFNVHGENCKDDCCFGETIDTIPQTRATRAGLL